MAAAGPATRRERWALRWAVLRFHTRRLGWSGLAGVALAAIALVFQLTVVQSLRQEAAGVRARVAALGPAPTEAAPAAERRAAAAHRFFPGREARAAALVRIYALAGEHGLSLESGDYQEVLPGGAAKGAAGGLLRYQINLPLGGTYPAWRAWLAAVMNELPAVALEDFSLKRDSAANPQLEARVRLTLYFEER